MKITTIRGWVHAGESSFAFVGGACDFEFDDLRLVNAHHNLVEILAMSDSRHVGVTVVVTDELGQIDEDPVWEGIGEASATFDKPPRLTRTGEDRNNQSGVSASLHDLPLEAGTYRIRGYVSGANAASQRRLTTSGTDAPPDDPDALMEQFRIEFAPAAALEQPRVIRRRYEQAQF